MRKKVKYKYEVKCTGFNDIVAGDYFEIDDAGNLMIMKDGGDFQDAAAAYKPDYWKSIKEVGTADA